MSKTVADLIRTLSLADPDAMVMVSDGTDAFEDVAVQDRGDVVVVRPADLSESIPVSALDQGWRLQ